MQLGNSKWENAVFNSRLQPTQLGLGTSATDQSLWKVNYDYGTSDNNGNVKIQQINVPGQFIASQFYDYDSLNRLKSAQEKIDGNQTWRQVFAYDRYGNRNFDTTYTTTLGSCPAAQCNPIVDTANNRFSSGQGYTYDASGNVTADAQGRTFVYDAENKQKEVKDSANTTIGQYLYDGDGKRVKKLSAQDTTVFAYDASGKLVAEYLLTNSTPNTPQTSYLTNDTLGSPRVITDQSGSIQSRRDFMPFGEEISGLGNRTSAVGYQADSTRQKFTGYERDTESDLDFAQARMYSSKLGRFSTVDPLLSSAHNSIAQSWNRYSYAYNNPITLTDPFGMWVWGEGFGGGKKEEDLTDGERRKRKEFINSLEKARIAGILLMTFEDIVDNFRGEEIARAVNSYGEEGVDNGVTIQIGKVDSGTAAKTKMNAPEYLRVLANGDVVPDITITFGNDISIDAVTVTHEGSHVGDNSDLAKVSLSNTALSTEDWLNSPENFTKYRTEERAYWVGSYVAESLGTNQNANGTEYWNVSWSKADRETKRANGIEKILKDQYKVTRVNQGPKLVNIGPQN